MIIRKAAIKSFIERPRNDYRAWKELTVTELDSMVGELPVRPPIWSKLRKHQKVCFLIGAYTKRFAFTLDVGCGKTLIALALARYFQKLGIIKHVLVVVPRRSNKTGWADEVRKHSLQTEVCVLDGTLEQRWAQLGTTEALITVETYGALLQMVCELEPSNLKKHKGTNKNRMVPSLKLLTLLAQKFDGLVLDESHHVKTKAKLPFRIARQLAKNAQTCFALTGTPFGRDPSDAWGQLYLIDGGHALGESLGLFRAALFSTVKDGYTGFDTYKFDTKNAGLLARMLAHSSIRYEAEQADLPALTPIERFVNLPVDAEVYYRRALIALKQSRGNFRETKNAFLRLRQISSGFVGYHDEDEDERAEFIFPYNPKLDLLLSIVEEIAHDRIIVFHDFLLSADIISKALIESGKTVTVMNGRTPDAKKALHDFTTGNAQVLVLQNSFGEGLNLQIARHGIFYESPVGTIARRQCEGRYIRQYSKHRKVFRFDLLVRGTMDEAIRRFHREGDDLFKAVLSGRYQPWSHITL